MRAGISEVRAALITPDARRAHAEEGSGERCGAVNDRRIDHLAPAGAACFQNPCQQPERQIQGAAAIVADEIQRNRGRGAAPADGVEHSGDGDIAEVMTGGLCERAALAPSGHSAVDQARISAEARLGAESQPFSHSRDEIPRSVHPPG